MEATYEEIQDQLRTKLEQNSTMLLCLITTQCMYVCMYLCMYVFMYVCMYVCMCVCVYVTVITYGILSTMQGSGEQ